MAAALRSVPRTQVARSTETQQKLARAAFDLIRRQGYANFRVAAVAREAGISQGGHLHHFPTKDLITMAAIEYAITVAAERSTRNLGRFAPGQNPVPAIVEDGRDYYFSPSFDVAMDVTKSSSDNPELRRRIAAAHRKFRTGAESGWMAVLLKCGWPNDDARDCIALTTSLVRGFAIRAMLKPDEAEVDRLMRRWISIAQIAFPYHQ